ncbi:MAG TPA: CBS domain-containing protein [Polyangiaceae bacterium]
MSALFTTPVREYMSKTLLSVRPETSLAEVQRIFEERDVWAVPVTDAQGALVGILSTTDLLRASTIVLTHVRAVPRVTVPPRTVSELMVRNVITVEADAPLRAAAAKMVEHRIHRVVVMRDGRPVGVCSTRDAMRAVFFHHIEVPLEAVVTRPVETIDHGDSIDSAIERLLVGNFHGLVVTDGDWPLGVFTHSEAMKARALPPLLRKTPVEQVMSYETICMDVKTPLFRVAGHAMQMRVRRILAVEHRRLSGIVTGFDLVRFMTLDP